MSLLNIIGLIAGVGVALYAINKYRLGKYSRFDLILAVTLGLGVALFAVFPDLTDIPTRLLGLARRWFGTLFLSNLIMFLLILYVLNQANRANREVGRLVRALAAKEYHDSFVPVAGEKSIFVVIPAYNEEDAIGGVLRTMPKDLYGYVVHPVVVVDGATDNTAEVVRRENYLVAPHIVNRGQGDALRTGFEISLGQGADIVMTMDADGQHRVEDMPKLVKPIIDNQADYVMGSRFKGEYEDRGGARHLGILGFTWLINLLGKVDITDCTNGFRAIRADGLSQFELREDRFNAPELIMEAARHKLRIQEVPVTIASRAAGESKKPRNFRYPLGFFRTIIEVWLR
ncbi:MAG: DUF2304 family protein [Anaerolineales bacterium]|nr:DUF2304 family protein [Anaerolineales bacterium]